VFEFVFAEIKGVCLTPEAILKKEDSVRKNPENCPCHRLPKLKQRLYYKRKFDYGNIAFCFW
jgi:hypothetical protein